MRPYHVLIPSRDLKACVRTINAFLAHHQGFSMERFIVIGGFSRSSLPEVRWIDQRSPFRLSQAWNEALALIPDSDAVLLSDDVLCKSEDLYDRISALSFELSGRAILMPGISGVDFGCSVLRPGHELRRELVEVPFICPYIPARIRKEVGPFDESFSGYGGEDFDYCLRTIKQGYRIYIPAYLRAHHIPGESAYRKTMEPAEFQQSLDANYQRIKAKHGFAYPHEPRQLKLGKEWAKIPFPSP